MDSESKIVVLVADDEPSTLAMVSSHLSSKGYQVLEASDGDQAWELAHEHLPHLVVLDVMMPGMSGWEVCRKIREAVSLAHTGVIMLTGIGVNLNEMTSPLYGADAYVDKPFEFSNLDRKIREALKRRQAGAVGRAESRGSAASGKPERKPNGIERPTMPAAAPAPLLKEVKRGREEAPKPLAKARPFALATKRSNTQRGSAKDSKNTDKTQLKAGSRKSSGPGNKQDSSTVRRASEASRERGKRTSIMKEKPRAKTPAKSGARAANAPRGSAAKGSADKNAKPVRAAKKAPAKKAPAKKAPAKKTPAKKAPAKKAPAKKAPAKKAPAKKAPAKKTPAKKAPAVTKKTPARRVAEPVSKKAVSKKSPAKKTPTKKSSTKDESVAVKAVKAVATMFGKLTPKPEEQKKAPPTPKPAPLKLPAPKKPRAAKAASKPAPAASPAYDDEPLENETETDDDTDTDTDTDDDEDDDLDQTSSEDEDEEDED